MVPMYQIVDEVKRTYDSQNIEIFGRNGTTQFESSVIRAGSPHRGVDDVINHNDTSLNPSIRTGHINHHPLPGHTNKIRETILKSALLLGIFLVSMVLESYYFFRLPQLTFCLTG